jgi:hypothetical protein
MSEKDIEDSAKGDLDPSLLPNSADVEVFEE